MAPYLIITLLLFLVLLLYFRIAEKYSITDTPNQRSSHVHPTIRGGGIVFPMAAFLWYAFFGFQNTWQIAGLLLVAAISFLDDIRPQSFKIRLSVQLAAVIILLA